MDLIRKCGWAYAALFVGVVVICLIPQFIDANGMVFGLFKLDLYDHTLHLASGLWSAIAAWKSRSASVQYFKIFGPLYFMDGVLGLITGSGYLDGGIFLYGPLDLDLTTRFFANLPHFIIGGGAAYVGYRLARRTA
jgi:hypothetical protein